MKRYICLFLAVISLMGAFCGCNKPDAKSGNSSATAEKGEVKNSTESLMDKLTREIDDEYLKKTNLPEYSSSQAAIHLTDKYAEKWKAVADEYYNKIMEYNGIAQVNESNYSSEDLHNFVTAMKTNWENYYQEECANYAKTLICVHGGGSMIGSFTSNHKYKLQMEWALELVGIYENLG